MSEKDLNIKYICEKTLLDKQDELVPIILEMIKNSYIAGLNQAEYDNTMGVIEENKRLKKQLNYIRSGEYYNQLRFENEMLQQVVDTTGVPSEVYDYLECVHKNTELLEENKKLKKELEDKEDYIKKLQGSKDRLDKYNYEITMQQKEFINYLNGYYLLLNDKPDLIEESQLDILKEVLGKYKEIIGGVK